ncbi:MAG: long-chain fatty acid--CoA ligase [Alphaproteobacteria bacterium]|nr:long-chain fatty acid--CoA ligase [Alphaproteobacteria bacterium]
MSEHHAVRVYPPLDPRWQTHAVPQLFWEGVKTRGAKVAMREKDMGIWRAISWTEYGEHAKHCGLGLKALGLGRGDVTAVIANNGPEWLYADLATICIGGICSGVYTTDSAKQLAYVVADCRAKVLFVEDDEQLDKALEARPQMPTVVKIVVFDMEGLHDFRDPMVISFDQLLDLGRQFEREHPGVWELEIAKAKPEDPAILIYTSGTTGPPKGALISHKNLTFQVYNGLRTLRSPVDENEEQLSFLPLCHIAERGFTTFRAVISGATVNFAESPETVPENIREVQPTIFLAVPRVWEKFYSGIMLAIRDATPMQQAAYRAAIGIGMKRAEAIIGGHEVPLWLDLAFRAADFLVLGNLKRMIGISRARYLVTGAAPIAPDLIKWYIALGSAMYEVYGQTENVGLATFMPEDRVKLGSVGIAAPDTEVKLSPEGEILLKGPHVFMGYLNQPEKTAETVRDGWLHTGDVGLIDNEGFVKITDRMKDIIITAGGKNVTPSEIENQLKFSPYISDAVVIGDRRKFLTALIMIDHDNVVKFAQDRNVPFTNFASLTRARAVQDLIEEEIEKVNAQFARVETVKKFRLIDQQITPEDEEITPTMKLKRKFVNQKYKGLIDEMYVGA